MFIDRKAAFFSLALSTFAVGGCGTAAGRLGPEGNRASTPAPTETITPLQFQTADCAIIGARVLVPAGWYFKQEPRSKGQEGACYVTQQPVSPTGSFTRGLIVEQVDLPSGMDGKKLARQIMSMPDEERSPVGGTIVENQSSSFPIVTGEFRSIVGRVLAREIGKVFVIRDKVYRVFFRAPITQWEQDFNNFGKKMFDGVEVEGHKTR